MNMHTLRNYKNRYCGQCQQECTCQCKVKNFIGFVGLQETPSSAFKSLMSTDVPTNIEFRQGKFVQKHGRVVK